MQRIETSALARNLILLATILASGITFLIGSTVSIALPSIQAVFKSSLYELQWVLNSFALSLAVLILVGGKLGDKFGRKQVFSIGILLFTLATFASGFSRSIAQLVVFQVVAGVGAALMIPGSLVIINTCFEEQEKGKIIGLWAGLFAAHLSGEVNGMSLTEDMKSAVLAQSAQVGAIEIPGSMQGEARTGVEQAIKDSFVYGYRIILIINALLAFSAAGTSIFLIRNDKSAES